MATVAETAKKMVVTLAELLGIEEQIKPLMGLPADTVWMMVIDLMKEEWDENNGSIDHLLTPAENPREQHRDAFEIVNKLVTSRGGPDLDSPPEDFVFDNDQFYETLTDLSKLVLFCCRSLFFPPNQSNEDENESDNDEQ